jgi:thiamine-monophosphate kinase
LLALASRFKVPLAGGDTSESPSEHVLADIVLLGAVPRGKALRRTGARPGDGIYVTGSLGGSAAELMLLAKGEVKAAGLKPDGEAHPHLFPEPRLDAGQALVRRKLATAGMDISDGLSTDLRHLCEASGVSAEVQTEALPLDPLASGEGDEAALRLALHGGEDYQLLFTARPSAKVPRQLGGVRLTRIGQITDRKRGRSLVTLVQQNGRRVDLARGGWEHLR